MPNQLPDSERRRFIESALQMGVPHDRIKRDLAQLEGYSPLSVMTTPMQSLDAAKLPGGGPPVTLQEQAEGREFYGRTLPRMAASTLPALAATPFTAGMSLPFAAVTEGAAAGLGDLAYQSVNKMVRGEDIKPLESAGVAGSQMLGTGVTRTAFDILSKMAGIAPQFSRYFRDVRNTGRYNRTMVEAGKGDEYELGEQIKSAIKEWKGTQTNPRVEKEAILSRETAAGTKIGARPIIQALDDVKLSTPKTAAGLKLNRELSEVQKRFMEVKTAPANFSQGQINPRSMATPRTDITPVELDEFLAKEIDNRIYKLSGTPKDQMLAKALANARETVREVLLSSLPDEARTLTRKTFEELNAREAATKAITPSLNSLETKIRNLFKPGHEGERRAIEFVSKRLGHDFIGEAYKLAQKRAFSPDERLAAKGLDALMELARGAVARPAVKVFAPLHPFIETAPSAGATAAFEQAMQQGRRQTP